MKLSCSCTSLKIGKLFEKMTLGSLGRLMMTCGNHDCCRYLDETSATGNVVRGWEGYIDSRPRNALAHKKDKRFRPSERVFSFSSFTSPVVTEDVRLAEAPLPRVPSPATKRPRPDGETQSQASKKRKKKREDTDSEF